MVSRLFLFLFFTVFGNSSDDRGNACQRYTAGRRDVFK